MGSRTRLPLTIVVDHCGFTSNPRSSPIRDLKRVEQPLPGLPSTTRSSPDFRTPSNSFKIVFSGPRPKNSLSRKGSISIEPTFFWMLIADPDPHTLRLFHTIPARLRRMLFWSKSLNNLSLQLALQVHVSDTTTGSCTYIWDHL
jgi:hypothetical protein